MTRYFTATVLGLGLVGSALGLAAGPAAASADDDRTAYIERTCERTIGNPPGDVLESSTVPAGGTPVAPGGVIEVTLTWETKTWSDSVLHKVIDCVTVNGRYRPNLSVEEKPTDNDGVFETEITVPEDLKDGDEICEQGFLSGGRSGSEQENSEETCFPVKGKASTSAPAAPPPAAEDDTGPASPPPCPECAATAVTAGAPPSALPQSNLPPEPAQSAPAAAPAAPPVLPVPQVLGLQESPTLPVTGASRSLQLGGALALVVGGWAVAAGARRRSGAAAPARQN